MVDSFREECMNISSKSCQDICCSNVANNKQMKLQFCESSAGEACAKSYLERSIASEMDGNYTFHTTSIIMSWTVRQMGPGHVHHTTWARMTANWHRQTNNSCWGQIPEETVASVPAGGDAVPYIHLELLSRHAVWIINTQIIANRNSAKQKTTCLTVIICQPTSQSMIFIFI